MDSPPKLQKLSDTHTKNLNKSTLLVLLHLITLQGLTDVACTVAAKKI